MPGVSPAAPSSLRNLPKRPIYLQVGRLIPETRRSWNNEITPQNRQVRMNPPDTPARDVTIDVRGEGFVVLFPDDDDPRHDLINTSFYVKRSANLPHLGAEGERTVLEDMEQLRADSPFAKEG